MIFFDTGVPQIAPEQMLWPIHGWYTEEVMWDIFYRKIDWYFKEE